MGLPEAVMMLILGIIFNVTLIIVARMGLETYRAINHERQETQRQREFSRQMYLEGLLNSASHRQAALAEARQEVRDIAS